MAKRITTAELSKGLREAKQEAEGLITVYNKFLKDVETTAELVKKTKNALNFADAKDLQKLNDALQQSNKILEQRLKLDKGVADQTKRSNTISQDQEKLAQQKIKTDREKIKLSQDQERLLQTQLRTQAQEKRALDQLRKAQEKQSRQLKENTTVYRRLTSATNKAQLRFKELAAEFGVSSKQAQNALNRFSKLDRALRSINDTARDGRRDVGRYSLATKGLATNFKTLATGLVGGLGVVEGLRLLSDVFRQGFEVSRQFGLSIAKVGALSGANAQQFALLKEQAKELGATTQFTASQVADLQVELAKLGFDPSQIQDSTKAILDFAVASGSDLARSGEVLAATLNAFNLEASESGRVADVAAKAFRSVPLDIEKFAIGLSTVGATANAAGISLEETTSLLGILADNGVDASSAATGLRKILAISAKEGKDYREVLKQITGSTNQLKTASEVFGLTAQSQAVILANSIGEIDLLTTSLNNAEGAASDAAAIIGDTLDGDIKKLQSAFEGLLLGGDNLNSLFRGLIKSTTALLGTVVSFTDAINNIIGSSRDLTEVIEEQNNARVEQVIVQKETADSAELLLGRFEELNSEENLSIEQKEELNKVQNDLIRVYGRSAFSINNETGELILNVKAIRAKIAAQRALESVEAKALLQEEAKIRSRQRRLADIEAEVSIITRSTVGELVGISDTGNEVADAVSNSFASFSELPGLVSTDVQTLVAGAKNGTIAFENALATVRGGLLETTEGISAFNSLTFNKLTSQLRTLSLEIETSLSDEGRLNEITRQLEILGVDFGALIEASTNKNGSFVPINQEETERVLTEEERRLREFNDKVEQAKFESNQRLLEQEIDFRRQVERIRIEQFSSNSIEEVEELERELNKLQLDRIEDVANEEIDLNNERIGLVTEYSDVLEDEEVRLFNLRKDNEDQINKIKEANFKADLNRKKEELKAEERNNDDSELTAEEIAKRADEREKALIDSSIAVTESFINNRKKVSEDRERDIENEIRETQNRQQQLITLANSSNAQVALLASQSLENQRKIEREKTLELQEERKKQIRLQRVLAGLEAFKANVGNDTGGDPVVKSLGQITSLIAALSSFDKGTDSIGSTDSPVDNKGGMLAINHPGEMIIQKSLVDQMGNPSRYQVAEVFKNFKEGNLVEKVPQNNYVLTSTSDPQLLGEIKALRKDVRNSKSSTEFMPFDTVKGALRYKERNGNRVNTHIEYV